jgi:hypothetical protein
MAGEDLLVLRGWFEYNWRFDQGINSIKYVKMTQSKELLLLLRILKNAYASSFRYKIKKRWCRKSEITLKIWQKNKS